MSLGSIIHRQRAPRKKDKVVLESDTRNAILHTIFDQEKTITEIAVDLSLSGSTIGYHVSVLEKFGKVCARRRGKNVIVALPKKYPLRIKDANQREILGIVKESVVSDIGPSPGIYQARLAEVLGMSHSGVKFHIDYLQELEMLKELKVNRRRYVYCPPEIYLVDDRVYRDGQAVMVDYSKL